ncbi:MAG: hypothetical protein KatS3mg081_1405 [Gemmatimonadales bacterium]|nr:MAG: hypothetical protein KatS3mg081_1405 [Gemmatimonadales bacterium]
MPNSGQRAWGGVFPLGSEPGSDLSGVTTPEQRLAMMWELALEAWELAGQALPTYDRASIPVRVRPLYPPADRLQG